jgi:DNA-binding NarL/FixJ family response regulator
VDDHPVVRRGLAQLLSDEPGLDVCGEANNGHEARELVAETQPDLAIIDLALPDVDGIDLIKSLRGRHPGLALLVLSMREEEIYAERALRAGARGYVTKGRPPEELLHAIETVLDGHVYLSTEMADTILHRVVRGNDRADATLLSALSDRELEVLRLIGDGLGPSQIADGLHISVRTVETHRNHLKQKLSLSDAAALRRFAVQWMRERQDG